MGPYIQSQSEVITADLTQFTDRYTALHREFAQSECLCRECDSGRAVEVVTVMMREVGQLQEEACNLIELQELLGTSVFNFSLLNEYDLICIVHMYGPQGWVSFFFFICLGWVFTTICLPP